LITVRGLDLLRSADVVAYDRLIGPELLAEARSDAELLDVGKAPRDHRVPQEQIHKLILDRAASGKRVVRLKGGDPFVFGRGYEELAACRAAGVDCWVIPGVTSATAAPASAGIPITHRQHVRAFAIVSAHPPSESTLPPLDFAVLAAMDTVIVLMGRENLADFVGSLMAAGRDVRTPTACIERATMPGQRVTVSTLEHIAAVADRDGLRAPMVTVIGEVARFAEDKDFLPNELRMESPCHPLAGKRVVITRPRSTAEPLRRALSASGAVPICFPMIRVAAPPSWEALDEAIRGLQRYTWLVLTSAHGVRAVFRRLFDRGLDARALAGLKVAAVGPATNRALRRWGIQADVVPDSFTGSALAALMIEKHGPGLGRVLCPRSDIAPPDLPQHLRSGGATVDEVIAYRTVEAKPSAAALRLIQQGVDVIVFFSPSAVGRFIALDINVEPAIIACIGPTTAQAAREAGLKVTVTAEEHTDDGLMDALQRYYE